MRWSERPPAVCSRLTPFAHLHCSQRSLSVAVAHLILVDMAVDLSRGKRSLVRVFASLIIKMSRSGFEAADQSG
jgi:hypothetical protein